MRKVIFSLLLASVFLLALFGAMRVGEVRAQRQLQQGGELILVSEAQDGNLRQVTGPETGGAPSAPNEPQISFIDSPTAGCVQPDRTKNECFINWYYMSVSDDPNYMITMTVKLNDFGYVAGYNGFFQTSMYVPYNMNPQGYKVACGAPGASGSPGWGKFYGYTIRARGTSGLGSANYGTVYCPPYLP